MLRKVRSSEAEGEIYTFYSLVMHRVVSTLVLESHRVEFKQRATNPSLASIKSQPQDEDLDSDMESDQEEEEDRRKREKERRREEKRQERKRVVESGSLDPMDPASYSDIPRGSWSSGLEKDDPVRAMDSSISGPQRD